MNVLIVEDEPRAASRLKALLGKVAPNSNLSGVTRSIEQSVAWLHTHPMPDLIIMDIHLADGNCFSIFDVCQITAPIIFCTAYDEYALKAFQTNGIAYLLKPVVEAEFRGAWRKLDHLRAALTTQQITDRRQVFRSLETGSQKYKSRFLIRAGEKLMPVRAEDIYVFLADQNGVKAVFQNGESYFLEYTLGELADLLDPGHFFQISRQAIIAAKAVTSTTNRARNARVQLDRIGLELSVSRNRTKAFRKWLEL